jgi:translocation and assembly module TamB
LNALPQPPFSNENSPRPVSDTRLKPRRSWKRLAAWIGAGAGLLIVFIVIAIAALLHSPRFHAYLLRTAQQKITAALGSQVNIQEFAIHWSGLSPTVDVYGVVVSGAAPYSEPPLLQADALHLAATVTSLLHRAWYIGDVGIEHPVVRIFADSNGHTNLPTPANQRSDNQGSVNIFDLGIRHLLLERGELYYNNRKSELSADLHDLTLQSSFDMLTRAYSGTLSYRNGHLKMPDANTVDHNFEARFVATSQEFRVENADLTLASSHLSVVASVRDYSQPKVHATYKAVIDGTELRRALNNPSLPAGTIESSGTVDYATPNSAQTSFLEALVANGDVRSAGLLVAGNNRPINITDIGARYSISKGDAAVSGIHAQVLGGSLNGTLSMHDVAGPTKSHLSASLRGVSIAQLQSAAQPPSSGVANQIALGGALNANADATWGKTMDDLLARADATLQASAQPAKGGTATSINGVIHARYAARGGQLSFTDSNLRTPQTTVTLNGTVSDKAALQASIVSNDLHELETIASAFRPAGAEPLGLYGHASVQAIVSGSTRAPQMSGQLTADNLKVRGTEWKLLRTNFTASPTELGAQNGQLDSATRGHVTFSLSTGLQKWAPTPSSPFQLQVSASQLNAAELMKAARSTAPVTGTLSADIVANGTQLAPAGHGTISLTAARISDEPIRSIDMRFEGTGSQIKSRLKVDLPAAGSANATITYEPATQAYELDVHAPGIKLDQLERVKAKNLELHGVLKVNASGRGTVRNPQMQAVIEIPQLQIRDQVVKNLKLQSNVADHVANFNLDSDVLDTHAGGHGTIHLNGEYLADATFDTKAISLAPLVALYVPSQAGNLTGQTELHASIRGPLKDKTRLEAHLLVPQLSVKYKDSIQLAAEAPIRADYTKGILNLQRSTIRGTGTELTFQANVPAAKDAPASMLVQGSVDLRLAQLISADITSGGELRFDIDSNGRRSDPNVQGQIRIENASFASAGAPLGLQNGNGILTLTRNRLDVTQFQGNVGGGTVTASGGVVYRPQLQFDLATAAKGVRVLYEQSIRTTLDSNLALTGNVDTAQLSGQVNVDQLSFTSDFDISDLMSQFGGDAMPPPTQGFSQNLNLDVGVQTPGGLNLTSRTLSLAGTANLRVRGTAAEPVLLGRMNLSSGDLIFSGNRYKLQGGTIDFTNRSRTEPVVDMAVNTNINQYEIQMHFWGPADHLHTNYASDPSLPPSDIINLIAFGKTSEAAAAEPTPPGSLGAQSLIASQVSSQITNRVEKLAGISQLSIDPVLGSSQQSPGARVAIQQRVTSKIFVTFATDVTSTEREVIQLEYQVNRRTSFSAVRDQNGGFAFETKFRKQW